MSNNNRYCVIMCGGVGSRFWPYSRASRPKQFLDFFGTGRSLLQMSVDRMKGIVPDENIILMTNEQYADIICEQLPQIKREQILLEPARRNTARASPGRPTTSCPQPRCPHHGGPERPPDPEVRRVPHQRAQGL